ENGNKLIAGTEWEAKSLEEVVKGTYAAGAVAQSGLFNNASQHWNHNLFWEVMGPNGKVMPGALEKAIVESFGSVAKFKEDFAAAGAGQFGSGWAWLVKDASGALKVTKTENGVNPLCFGQTALLGCDVWEHSYYIDFRNKRPAYIANFLDKLVDWEAVAAKL
ncbi:MAG: superoxide dismutase, partial [Pseudomonadota bacterium]